MIPCVISISVRVSRGVSCMSIMSLYAFSGQSLPYALRAIMYSVSAVYVRQNRSIQVEGAFGVLKQNRDFRRFFVRSKEKTETQFFLLAFAFNIKKLWNRTLDNRLGVDLFQKEAA